MRRTLATLVAAAALAALAPSHAVASHPCWDFNELTCWATRPCVKNICT